MTMFLITIGPVYYMMSRCQVKNQAGGGFSAESKIKP